MHVSGFKKSFIRRSLYSSVFDRVAFTMFKDGREKNYYYRSILGLV